MSSPESSQNQNQISYPESNILHYLLTHDLYTTSPTACTLTENRIKQRFTDTAGKAQDLYCWKGRIQTHPDCAIGVTCDPYSYTNARSAFCRTWGCKPDLYVSNAGTIDAGLPPMNQRGGVIVYNNRDKCKGGFASQLNCVMDGFRQSVSNMMDPKNRNRFLMGTVAVMLLAVIGAIAFRKYRKKFKRGKHISPI